MEKCNRRRTPEDDAKNLESTMENEQEAKGTKLKEKFEDVGGVSPAPGLLADLNLSRGELCTGGQQQIGFGRCEWNVHNLSHH